MDNPFNDITFNITNHFVEFHKNEVNVQELCRNISTLIRIHAEKLKQNGEISFSGQQDIWRKYFQNMPYELKNEAFNIIHDDHNIAHEQVMKFLDEGKQWSLARLDIRSERIHLYLHRPVLLKSLIPQVLTRRNYGELKKSQSLKISIKSLQENGLDRQELSFYRTQLLDNALKRLLDYSRWMQVDDINVSANSDDVLEIQTQSIASKLPKDVQPSGAARTIKCGLVTDPANKGKMCQLTTDEYHKLRSNDMCLMALHKYGIRVKQDERFCALMERLGAAAVTVDLLEVKHSSPVQIIRNGQGSTKGASFILYNSARLETILRTFQERVDNGQYEPLPDLREINWHLLIEEEEWQLVFVYLAGFPDLIDRCLEQLERGICNTHLIIKYLHGFVAVFSVYYRRIRILTEKRDHLMPYVYARIYLIKAIREVLNKTLALLDIQPVEFM